MSHVDQSVHNSSADDQNKQGFSFRRRRHLPRDYMRWRLYEVALPFGITLFVLFWLVVEFSLSNKHPGDALIAVTGAGDFLIFGALLVLNVSGTLLIESNRNKLPQESDNHVTNLNNTLGVAVFLLIFYAAVRISYHTVDAFQQHAIQFSFAVISTLVLLIVLLWIDKLVWELHLTRIDNLIRGTQFNAQFNWG